MLFSDPDLKKEFDRWMRKVGDHDPYKGKNTLGIRDVLRAHFLILDYFSSEMQGQGIGGIGPKSMDLLHSAMYRQFVTMGGRDKWPTMLEKCATLMFGIVKDHPFHDANKRTAFLTTLFFLKEHGRTPTAKQKEIEDFVVDVADNQLEKYKRFQDLKKKVQDPEVQFIADFLRRCTREEQHGEKTLTFNELQRLLNRYGFTLTNASKNFIDLVQIVEKHKYFGLLGPKVKRETLLVQVGFPGWKSQVSKPALRSIRSACGMTQENGWDSHAFYNDTDPLNALIDTYAAPLKRLAHR
jgi:death-on-curing family protein